MKSSILDTIRRYKLSFWGSSGYRPTQLFVGRKEYETLKLELKEQGTYFPLDKELERPMVDGLKLFLMNADSFLHVS